MVQVEKFGIPRNVTSSMKLTGNQTKCRVKTDGDVLEAFEVAIWVRQMTTSIVFNITQEGVLQKVWQIDLRIRIRVNRVKDNDNDKDKGDEYIKN